MDRAAFREKSQKPGYFERYASQLLSGFVDDNTLDLSELRGALTPGTCNSLIVYHQLQNVSDYRDRLRSWFEALSVGGHLILVVPHSFLAERQLALPVRDRPSQKRLYTPASLLLEVEEALVPNSYRVRALCDDDADYTYARENDEPRTGQSDIILVLERTHLPNWQLDNSPVATADAPNYQFAAPRTRIEIMTSLPAQRVVLLKLDHLGDFVMGIPALQRARILFEDAHITLVVGSWNLELAEKLNVADRVVVFDAFPRNSSEEDVDVPGKRALFDAALPDHYDLAIDLRTDTDTRTLLGRIKAKVKAGLGRKSEFPFLDVALALEIGRVEHEAARESRLDHQAFSFQDAVQRFDHRACFSGGNADPGMALIWGPYWRLRAGNYVFDPFLEIDAARPGLLMLDIGLNAARRIRRYAAPGDELRLTFDVEQDDSAFEFRVWALDEFPIPNFNFYGGRLVRQGAPGFLHQSDYIELLLDLVARRLGSKGILVETHG